MTTLRNDRIAMEFDEQGWLAGLSDAAGNIRVPIDPDGRTEVFEIQLRNDAGAVVKVTPQAPPQMKLRRRALRCEWQVSREWGTLNVVGTVKLPSGSRVSEWRLQVKNQTDLAIWQVAYPRVTGLSPFENAEGPDWLAMPFLMGERIPHPVQYVNGPEKIIPTWARSEYGVFDVEGGKADFAFSYPGMWTMQYLAYGHPETGGIYFGAHDGKALYKRFGFYADGENGKNAALVMKQFPEDRTATGADFKSLYPAMVGVYEGDWWGASSIYRDWALDQVWCRKGPTRQRTDIPAWAKENDLWYWNWQFWHNIRPEQIVPAIKYLKKSFDCGVAFHWYGSSGTTFAGYLPEVVPADPDALNLLVNAVRELREAGVPAIPYIQGRRWAPDTISFKKANGMDWVAVDENGDPSEQMNQYRLTMCPTAKCHHDILRRMTCKVIDKCGMAGAYLDVISSCFSVPCFNKNHNHPPGGHDHWSRGYRENLKKIQRAIKKRGPDNIITSESVIECYQDLLDLDLAREISNIRGMTGCADALPIPLFHSVYHDYHLTYGTVSTFKPNTGDRLFNFDAFRLREALCLVGGNQLMVSGFFAGDEKREEMQPQLRYMETLVAAHVAARKWLNLGAWKPPAALQCDVVDVDMTESQTKPSPPKRGIPAILSGCFELEGELCIALVNHTAQPRTATLQLDPSAYGLDGQRFSVRKIYPENAEPASSGSQQIDINVRVPAASAQVFVVAPK